MRIVATADSHFGYEYGRSSVAKKESIQRMNQAFENILNEAISLQADLVLHGGDVFNRSSPKKEVIEQAYDIIDRFAEEDIPLVIIPGNHDKSVLPESLVNHLNKHIHFLNKFSLLDFSEISILSFPFVSGDPKIIFEKAIRKAKEEPSKKIIILCHQLFDGASFGPHNYVFTNRLDTLKTDKLPDNVLFVVSGHIHRFQNIQNGRVYYTGSVERTSFMEITEPKGYLLIEIEGDYHCVRFCKTESVPMDVIEYDIGEMGLISSVINEDEINNKSRTLLRFTGRSLDANEIKFLWARFPAKEYPLLRFSPRNSDMVLKKLYNIKKE